MHTAAQEGGPAKHQALAEQPEHLRLSPLDLRETMHEIAKWRHCYHEAALQDLEREGQVAEDILT